MKEILSIHYYHEEYYEPSITVEVVDESARRREDNIYMDSSLQLVNFLLEHHTYYKHEMDLKLTLDHLRFIKHTEFDILVENYKYIQKIKTRAYDLATPECDWVDKFRAYVYGEDGGYGGFQQELILFRDPTMICQHPKTFKKMVSNNLISEFSILLDGDSKSSHLKTLIANIDNIDATIKGYESDIKNIRKHIRAQKSRKLELEAELKVLKETKEE